MNVINAIWFWSDHEFIFADVDLELEKGDLD